jgi:hypothetical protein
MNPRTCTFDYGDPLTRLFGCAVDRSNPGALVLDWPHIKGFEPLTVEDDQQATGLVLAHVRSKSDVQIKMFILQAPVMCSLSVQPQQRAALKHDLNVLTARLFVYEMMGDAQDIDRHVVFMLNCTRAAMGLQVNWPKDIAPDLKQELEGFYTALRESMNDDTASREVDLSVN